MHLFHYSVGSLFIHFVRQNLFVFRSRDHGRRFAAPLPYTSSVFQAPRRCLKAGCAEWAQTRVSFYYLNALCKPRQVGKPRAATRAMAPPPAPPPSGQAEGSGFARLPRMRGAPGRGGRRGLGWRFLCCGAVRAGPGRPAPWLKCSSSCSTRTCRSSASLWCSSASSLPAAWCWAGECGGGSIWEPLRPCGADVARGGRFGVTGSGCGGLAV